MTAARSLSFLLPGDIDTRTGGYAYDRSILAGLRELGWQVDVRQLDASFPFPTQSALQSARETLASLADGTLVMIDGLALGAMPDLVALEATRLKLIGLVHHPLALETGLDAQRASDLKHSETRALAATRAVVVTSPATARLLKDFAVPGDCITVVEPGTAPAPEAPGSGAKTLALLCVASLTARKGHDVLFDALAELRAHDWHLTCVGGDMGNRGVLPRMLARLQALGIADRVTFAGEGDDALVAAAYARADVFVLPTHYEGYGMVVAEALARALPVISTHTGAIPDLVGERAGLVVPPGDGDVLREALRRLMQEPGLLATLRAGARQVRSTLPTWQESAQKLAVLLTKVQRAEAFPQPGPLPLREREKSGFSAEWLALREPADRAARPLALIDWLAPSLKRSAPLRVLDLATGTASNLRYLGPRIGGAQHWVLADHDQALLDSIPASPGEWEGRCVIERRLIDLARQLDHIDFGCFDLVTTAALLDLVGAPWLDGLLGHCRQAGCAVLFALSYDGLMEFAPDEPEDLMIRDLVNAHQRTDKGFGPALGPEAASRSAALLQNQGYEVLSQRSDWQVDGLQAQLQGELIAGWADAAMEMAPHWQREISGWRERRLAHVISGHSQLRVGHLDIAARPR